MQLGCKAGVLENVLGIQKCMDEVKEHIKKELPEYELVLTILCPWPGCIGHTWAHCKVECNHCKALCTISFLRTQLGVNVARKRYYFLLIRKSCLAGNFANIVSETVQALTNAFDGVIPWPAAQCVHCVECQVSRSMSKSCQQCSVQAVFCTAPPKANVSPAQWNGSPFPEGEGKGQLASFKAKALSTSLLLCKDTNMKDYDIESKRQPLSYISKLIQSKLQLSSRPRKSEPKWRHIHWEYMAARQARLALNGQIFSKHGLEYNGSCALATRGRTLESRAWSKASRYGKRKWKHLALHRPPGEHHAFWHRYCLLSRHWQSWRSTSPDGWHAIFLRTWIVCRLWQTHRIPLCVSRLCPSNAIVRWYLTMNTTNVSQGLVGIIGFGKSSVLS